MAEDVSEKKKSSLGMRLLKRCLLSPINTVLLVAVLYFAVRVYFFESSFSDKALLCGTVALWVFWFVAKQIFMLLVLLGLLGGGAYIYYHYSRLEAIKCEDAGGYWNDNTKTCEAKRSLWEKIQNFFAEENAVKKKNADNGETTNKKTEN